MNRNGDMNVCFAHACAAVMCMVRVVANRPACGPDAEAFQGWSSRLSRHTSCLVIAESKGECQYSCCGVWNDVSQKDIFPIAGFAQAVNTTLGCSDALSQYITLLFDAKSRDTFLGVC